MSDSDRLLHEWSADTMRALMLVNGRLASRLEQLEAALHSRRGGDV